MLISINIIFSLNVFALYPIAASVLPSHATHEVQGALGHLFSGASIMPKLKGIKVFFFICSFIEHLVCWELK